MKATLIGLAMIALMPVTALAFQCPTLQQKIDGEFGKRFDATASKVRQMAAHAAALHKEGKHAESVKAYQEAMAAGNMKK
jgi:hypothetical protein